MIVIQPGAVYAFIDPKEIDDLKLEAKPHGKLAEPCGSVPHQNDERSGSQTNQGR
jgi:hypothetical protein